MNVLFFRRVVERAHANTPYSAALIRDRLTVGLHSPATPIAEAKVEENVQLSTRMLPSFRNRQKSRSFGGLGCRPAFTVSWWLKQILEIRADGAATVRMWTSGFIRVLEERSSVSTTPSDAPS